MTVVHPPAPWWAGYTLDPVTRTVRYSGRSAHSLSTGDGAFLEAMLFRNEAPIELVDEQWESPELRLIIYGRYSDSHGGVIEYRLTNIRREDPPPDLFCGAARLHLGQPSGVP